MKKLFSLIIFALLPLMASADHAKIDGIYYDLQTYNKQAWVKSSDTKYTGSITIPSTVTYNGVTYSVTYIEAEAFLGCSGLTSVTIPNSVTSIVDGAFNGCKGLTTVIIPDGVTSIENSVFYGCSGLKSVTIPSSVTSIGSYAFYNCFNLTEVTIPSSVTSIGENAFDGCSGLRTVTIPNSVTELGGYAFSGCTGNLIINCNIPDASYVYSSAFSGSKFNSVKIGDEVTLIGDKAFLGCYNLKSVTIGNSVTTIGSYSFSSCKGLTELSLPNSLISIGYEAFSGCSGLTSVTIGNSVTTIGYSAFMGCSGLTSVTIPSSVTTIAGRSFSGCSNLVSILVESGNKNYDSRDNCNAIIETASNTLVQGCKNTRIPNSVTAIGHNAFNNNSELTEVSIPNSVTTIGQEVFYGCSGLTSVTIPNSVTEIGNSTFGSCYFEKENFVNNSTLDANANNYWGATIVDNRENGFIIKDGVLIRYTGKEVSITVPNSVTTIGYSAFIGCSGLTSVTIPNSVTSISDYAFIECSSLTEVKISNSVTAIGKMAFYGCSSLTSLTVESGNTKYDSRDNCNAIIETGSNILVAGCNNTVIPNSVTAIGEYAFSSRSGFTSITIPDGVTSIGNSAFYNCSGLTSIKVSDNVTSIGNSAFSGCSSLTDVYCCAENVPSTGAWVFDNTPIPSATLHVPEGSVDAYKAAYPWNQFGNIVALDDEPVAAGIAIDETNFPDTNFRNWLLAQDYGADGVLTEEEIAGITSIKVGGKNIKSLQGIENFTALQELDCNKSQLEAIDLSHNIALTNLRCYANKLTSLDLSKNIALEELQCDNNQLTSLDVSGCAALKKLYCYNNQLTNLDLSKNTALEYLNCLSNKLTFIDVSGCGSLQTLYCYKNQINGEDMDAFVANLPTVVNKPLYVIYSTNEGNVMTTTQVAAAKAKGWTPYYYDGNIMQEYAGSEPEPMEKCATPFVAFYGGKLIFRCATPDVIYVCKISNIEFETDGTDVSLPSKITISVYATKEGYEPSDVLTQDIDPKLLLGKLGDVNGDGEIGMPDVMYIIQYILNGKFPNE